MVEPVCETGQEEPKLRSEEIEVAEHSEMFAESFLTTRGLKDPFFEMERKEHDLTEQV